MPVRRCLLLLAFSALIATPVCASETAEASAPTPEQIKFFETKIRPILVERCQKCHGDEKQQSGLRLDSRAALTVGGDSGAAMTPGKPEESLLVEAINYESFEMPPDGKLPDEQIAALTEWIKMGAPWPGGDDEPAPVREKAPKITAEDRAFWSFQPLSNPSAPDVADAGWATNDIDRFIFRRLEQEGLAPSPRADKLRLMRRAYFDLLGLPPSPPEVDAFMADESADAYERLIDRLLDDPRYGERWARHWLDLVRYAESDGFKQDAYRPDAWRYRDYVIRSLNADKPYDQFVKEQLAGDEIAPHDPEALIAVSYLRHGMYEYNQRDVRTQWDNIINDITDVTGDVFLGMGMGCARCHDHKFDPILQKDYFRLRAFFTPLLPRDDLPLGNPEKVAQYQQQLAEWRDKTAELRAQIDEIERPHREKAARAAFDKFPPDIRDILLEDPAQRDPLEQQLAAMADRQIQPEFDKLDIDKKLKGEEKEQWEALQKQLAEFDELKPKPLPPAFTVSDVGSNAPPTVIPKDRSETDIEPGFLTIFDESAATIDRSETRSDTTGRRTALAEWITQPDNPLTTRVIVNRIWQYHFGRGLVETSSDFGRLGQPPTHPELLDWLVARFVEEGWRFKPLHRLIMTSSTYRQSALEPSSDVARLKDPANRLLWKMNVHRLDAEQIRDSMLAVSGELDLKQGGPSVEYDAPRRSVYVKQMRNEHDPLLAAFDGADGIVSTSQRNVTTTPTQSLLMINGGWVLKRSQALAKRLAGEKLDSIDDYVEEAYRLALCRPPTAEEQSLAAQFVAAQTRQFIATQEKAPLPEVAKIPGRAATAVDLRPSGPRAFMAAPRSESFPAADFTIEAVVLLRSMYEDASVRTIVSQWSGANDKAGWSLGVTSKKSAYEPRNLILQLVGKEAGGQLTYEVVASGLHLELNTPYFVAAVVETTDAGTNVHFHVKDLASDAAPQTAAVGSRITSGFQSDQLLMIGGRHGQNRHIWDGLIEEVKLSAAALDSSELLIAQAEAGERVVGHWRFDAPELLKDASGRGNDLQPIHAPDAKPTNPQSAALADFCHVLLNSNEFLYVD